MGQLSNDQVVEQHIGYGNLSSFLCVRCHMLLSKDANTYQLQRKKVKQGCKDYWSFSKE